MLPSLLNEGKFPKGERHEKNGQYLVAWEYNVLDVVSLTRVPSTQLYTP